ncbi:hypothetical protein DITRI_Ditri01bG0203000 [Diplodiscus trichospermus]
MTVGAGIAVSDRRLTVFGNCILHDVHDNVVITPASGSGDAMINGAFIESDQIRREAEESFQLESSNEAEQSVVYAVFLPILEGDFRAVLQGNEQNEMDICLESGDPAVEKFGDSHLVFVAAGSDPYDLITSSVKTVEKHLQTFCHRDIKKMPDILNWFGWCTWDAFYTNVSAEGVNQGLESLEKGGTPSKFVIIDDGWQTVGMDPTGIEYISDCTANFANRLIDIKENHKFQKNGKEGHRVDDPEMGLGCVVSEMKDRHSLKYVYKWHAITGYRGGVKPGISEMELYVPKLVFPNPSPGVHSNDYSDVWQSITTNGVGLVNPDKVFDFYNDLHSYLASAGIDSVKVTVQSILETLGAGYGGRVKLTRKYHQALEASISSNFHENAIIACMSHNTDALYSAKSTAVTRASDDFFPRDPASHTIHIASVAYNTIFVGEFMQPDWDMFHSLHPMAEYHGAACAVGGCAIYVSDKPGQHDFNLLKKLVLPDGSVLRAKLPGRPTRDCLFSDPVRDGKR